MQRDTHQPTPISIVRDHVEAWRKAQGWSRETLAQTIVEAHERLGLHLATGIRFEPPTTDPYERTRVNADRIYRWLDDTSKDKNLLPFNFIWSVLAAMPMERRLALADDLLTPVGMGARDESDEALESLGGLDEGALVIEHFRAVVTSSAGSTQALGELIDGIAPGEPEAAKVHLTRTQAAIKRSLAFLSRLIRRKKGGR